MTRQVASDILGRWPSGSMALELKTRVTFKRKVGGYLGEEPTEDIFTQWKVQGSSKDPILNR